MSTDTEQPPRLIHVATPDGSPLVMFRLRDLQDALGITIPAPMMDYLSELESQRGPALWRNDTYPDYICVDRAAFIELCLRLTIGRP